jgi:UDP-N-acetylenolpyruvoylglucosamine reductase
MMPSRPLIRTDVDLAWLNSYRVRATAKLCAFPETVSDLRGLAGRPWRILGHGNNVILASAYYGEAVPMLCMREFDKAIRIEGEIVRVGAASSLASFA